MSDQSAMQWATEAYVDALLGHERLWKVDLGNLSETVGIPFHRMRLREREDWKKLVALRQQFIANPRGPVILPASVAWKDWASKTIAAASILEEQRRWTAAPIRAAALRAGNAARNAMLGKSSPTESARKIGIAALIIAALGALASAARAVRGD